MSKSTSTARVRNKTRCRRDQSQSRLDFWFSITNGTPAAKHASATRTENSAHFSPRRLTEGEGAEPFARVHEVHGGANQTHHNSLRRIQPTTTSATSRRVTSNKSESFTSKGGANRKPYSDMAPDKAPHPAKISKKATAFGKRGPLRGTFDLAWSTVRSSSKVAKSSAFSNDGGCTLINGSPGSRRRTALEIKARGCTHSP